MTQIADDPEIGRAVRLDDATVNLLEAGSGGCAPGLRLALDQPDRVGRLVLMRTSGTPFPVTDGLDACGATSLLASRWRTSCGTFRLRRIDHLRRSHRDAVPGEHATGLPGALFRSLSGASSAVGGRDVAVDTPDELAAMRTPTLLIHGRDDKVIPVSSSRQLAEQIPGARLEVIPECGHWVQIEKTDEFISLVSEFLGEDGS